MSSRSNVTVAVCVWLGVLPCAAIAQVLHAASTQLQDVEVTATADETPPASHSRTDAQTMTHRDIRQFDDLSRRAEPGVTFNRSNQSIAIRGLDRDRVATRLDGIPLPWLNDAVRGVSGGLDAVDFHSLSAIDIERGVNAAQAGSGVLAGSVHLHTLAPDDLLGSQQPFAALIKGDIDSADRSRGANAAFAGRLGDTTWLLQAGLRSGHALANQGSTGGYGAARTAALPADSTQRSVLFKLQRPFTGGHQVGLTAERFERQKDIDDRIHQGTAGTVSPQYALRHNTSIDENQRTRFSMSHQYVAPDAAAFVDRATTTAYWQHLRREDRQRAFRLGTVEGPFGRSSQIEKTQYGITSEVSKKLPGQLLHLGGEWHHTTTEQYNAGYDSCPKPLPTPPAIGFGLYYACVNLHTNQADMPRTPGTAWALSIRDDIALRDTLQLTPGLRYDRYRFDPRRTGDYGQNGNPRILRRNDGDKLSGSLSLTWQAQAHTTLYARWAQGFKAPDANQLYTTFINTGVGYAQLGNPDLKPEESSGYEIGARLGGQRLGGHLSLFDNRYRHFIDTAPARAEDYGLPAGAFPYGVSALTNRDKVRIYGAEAASHWRFSPGWTLWGSLAWAVGQDRDNKRHLNSVAPLTGTVGLGYAHERHGATLLLSAAKRRSKVADPAQDFRSPGYGVVDFTAYWQPAPLKGIRLQAGVFNLFDKKYWQTQNLPDNTVRSARQPDDYYSEPGRSFRLALSWRYP